MDPVLAQVRLKNMVAWKQQPTLCQEDIDMLLLAARRIDASGYDWSSPNWVPTYHLDWAAREAWAWKAGAASDRYKIVGDGTELNRHQVYEHCNKMYLLYDRKASGQPHSIRSHGNLVEDRLGAYSTVPWWWELAGN